jgi:hypothetical protein
MRTYSRQIKKQKVKRIIQKLEEAAEILKDLDSQTNTEEYKDYRKWVLDLLSSDSGECGLKALFKKL